MRLPFGFEHHRARGRVIGDSKLKAAAPVGVFGVAVIERDGGVRLVDLAVNPQAALSDGGIGDRKSGDG
jgi:hypothetical protein